MSFSQRLWTLVVAAALLNSNPVIARVSWDYPYTPKDTVVDRLHGIEVVDPYRWLENAADTCVTKWTAAQNTLTNEYLSSLPQRQWVQGRLEQLARCESTDFADVLDGPRRFVWRKTIHDDHPILYWQEDPTAPQCELLNPNRWEKGAKLDFAVPSRDGTYVAFGVSSRGNECPEIRVLHVASGQVMPDTVLGSRQGWPEGLLAWLPGNTGFYYTAFPEPGQIAASEAEYWSAVYFHHLGTTKESDQCVFDHPTVREYFHMAQVTDDGRFAVFIREFGTWSQVYLQPLGNDQPQPLIPLVSGTDTNNMVAMAGDHIILLTDDGAPNYRAFLIDPQQPERANWKLLLPESQDRLVGVTAVAGHYFAAYLHHAYTVIRVFDSQGQWVRTVPLDSMGTADISGFWHKPEAWVHFTSFAHPLTHYSYDIEQNMLDPLETTKRAVETSRYAVEQVWYPSRDGTKISMFLVYDQTCCLYGPTLLTGYGGFGVPITPQFNAVYIPFLEAGGMLAIANLRGGGEYGEEWHQAGMLEKKQNVFDDFIAAAEWLIAQELTTPDTLAIRGRSNGGLLVGAVTTQRPDLFRATLCEVPLLDMVRYHKFGYSNLWSGEYGNSENSDQFEYLMRYSPYHQVIDGIRYPAVLIRGSENDARTDPLHARKMIARFQAADPKGLPKLCLIDKDSGHFGGTTIMEQVSQQTAGLTFLMEQLGMSTPDCCR